jgi:hypothetical protein
MNDDGGFPAGHPRPLSPAWRALAYGLAWLPPLWFLFFVFRRFGPIFDKLQEKGRL